MAAAKSGPAARNKIAEKLRKFREEKKMSQRELATKTNMTVATIVNIEKGHTNFGLDRVLLILEALEQDLTIPV